MEGGGKRVRSTGVRGQGGTVYRRASTYIGRMKGTGEERGVNWWERSELGEE